MKVPMNTYIPLAVLLSLYFIFPGNVYSFTTGVQREFSVAAWKKSFELYGDFLLECGYRTVHENTLSSVDIACVWMRLNFCTLTHTYR